MKLHYVIRTGELLLDGKLFMKAYAGRGAGKNNPDMTYVKNEGPLPCGYYTIGDPYTHDDLGPVCFNLTPDPGNTMFSRSLFRIHADSAAHPGDASHGCIVSVTTGNRSGRQCREALAQIIKSDTRILTVVAERKDVR